MPDAAPGAAHSRFARRDQRLATGAEDVLLIRKRLNPGESLGREVHLGQISHTDRIAVRKESNPVLDGRIVDTQVGASRSEKRPLRSLCARGDRVKQHFAAARGPVDIPHELDRTAAKNRGRLQLGWSPCVVIYIVPDMRHCLSS